MKVQAESEFLDQVCTHLKAQRLLVRSPLKFSFRVERIAGVPFASLWFRTRGCQHDHKGGCTMCNYLVGPAISCDEMVENVRTGLALLPTDEAMILLVSPSGSMLDEWEVPAPAREGILRLVRETSCRTYICETRVETITEDKVRQYVEILDNKTACIEVGLESADPWILQHCINKAISLGQYIESMTLLRKYNVPSIANVLVGAPFLSAREAIEDAVRTVQWAFAHGTNTCVIFPVHVKQWTLVEWLWRHGFYSPPSLWSLVEVLARLGPAFAQRVTISWYKVYSEESPWGELDPVDDLSYLASSVTCEQCQPQVIRLLDAYRDTNDFNIVQELVEMECACKDAWRATLQTDEPSSLKNRVAHIYEAIGRDVLGHDWWNTNGVSVLSEVKSLEKDCIHHKNAQ